MASFDTTVLLDLVGRAGRRRQGEAEAKLRQLELDRPHSVTRFTVAEALVGFERSPDPGRERVAIDRILSGLQILEFDARSMRLYPKIFVHLQRVGRLPGVMDVLIAAVVLSHGQRFVTRNPEHFQHVPGLRVDSY